MDSRVRIPGIIADNLVNNTDNIQTITYRFEVSASGFTSTAIQTAVVTVNPVPTMTITNTNLVINSGGTTDILINTLTENGQVRLKSVVKSDPDLPVIQQLEHHSRMVPG
ncbi:MAG: hypothetical protein U5K79_22490 [Cyclobacteriaceae bacterium]|nr:hypothetical protein [Cyclobacteriaceae bacterium]